MANIFTPVPEEKKAYQMIGSVPVFLNVSKKILARESIFRSIDCNVAHDLKRGPSFLTEEQIKMSSIYEKMIQRIQKAKAKQEEEVKEHEKAMERMSNQIKWLKTSVQQQKVEMWQAKNEIMQLQELLEEEMEEYNMLCEEMRAEEEEEEFDDEEGMQNEDEGYEVEQMGSGEDMSEGEDEEGDMSGSVEQISKPSCSIKYFISNRTITSPGLSSKNLQVGMGMNLNYSQKNAQPAGSYEPISIMEENKDTLSEQNLLSFKKSQKLVCEEHHNLSQEQQQKLQ